MRMRDVYDDSLALSAARAQYFAANGFGTDGRYGAAWVDVKIGPLPARIPNSQGRVRAVRFHDLHHLLTGYRTTFHGECEIGAWEVATGCANHGAAWLLNLGVFGCGLLSAPGDMWRAFRRGRASGNLYRATFDEALLGRRLGDVRRELRLSEPPRPAAAGDRMAFAGWSLVALLTILGAMVWSPVMLPLFAVLSRLAPSRPA